MNFNKHGDLKDKHAVLSGSKYHWINYDTNRLKEYYLSSVAAARGTELHEFAATCIRLGQKLPRSHKTLNMYVNDAIGYGMTPEQPLFFSENCFGTADAISFENMFLRIHDLKTGVTPAHIEQLYVYAALFCLEYGIKPFDIQTELRIYQNDDVLMEVGAPNYISQIMATIKHHDKVIRKLKRAQEG